MKTQIVSESGVDIAIVQAEQILITDGQDALDFMMNLHHETGCRHIILNKEAFGEAFFDLRTNVAGDILQKFVNYHFNLAITGDFSVYNSQALRDFIIECNRGQHIFFMADVQEALVKLTAL